MKPYINAFFCQICRIHEPLGLFTSHLVTMNICKYGKYDIVFKPQENLNFPRKMNVSLLVSTWQSDNMQLFASLCQCTVTHLGGIFYFYSLYQRRLVFLLLRTTSQIRTHYLDPSFKVLTMYNEQVIKNEPLTSVSAHCAVSVVCQPRCNL